MKPIIAAGLLSLLSTACGGTTECADSPADPPSWATVHAILRTNCGLCHSKSSAQTPYDGPGEFADEGEGTAFRQARKQTEPCEPDASPLYTYLLESAGPLRMPYLPIEGPLSDADTQTIHDWIAAGANRE